MPLITMNGIDNMEIKNKQIISSDHKPKVHKNETTRIHRANNQPKLFLM